MKKKIVLKLFLLLTLQLVKADDEVIPGNLEVDTSVNSIPSDLKYSSPYADPAKYYFADSFDDKVQFATKWIKSRAKKDDIADEISKYDGEWNVELPQKPLFPNDMGLVLKSKAKHAAIASRLARPFVFSNKPLVVQYEVNLQDGQECGGSYIKLLSSGKEIDDLKQFQDKTPYTIMFGPDKCGNDIKLHFIFRHVNPINGTITEKHCRKAKDRLDDAFKDKQPHLYQLIVRPDNTYLIRFDHKVINEGSLLTDFTPPVNPAREIDDPNDFKPENWDEREKIPDPDAKRPDDWNEDEPAQIPDPNASQPEGWLDNVEEMVPDPNAEKPVDWDIEMDGDWEAPLIVNPACEKAVGCGLWKAPMIPNPNYKGKWRAPLIDNPNYQGKWAPRKISNPDFFEDNNPFKMSTIGAIGIELWSMSSDILFDNLIITDDESAANEWAAETFDLKRKLIDREANTLWDRAMKYMGHKPGYWFAYFTYCAIPLIAYVWFLVRRRHQDEETFVSRILKYTNENPWMYAVLIIVVGLPLAVIFYLACSSKSSPHSPTSRAKKTDEHIPDTEDQEDNVRNKSNLNSISGEAQTQNTEDIGIEAVFKGKNVDDDENEDEEDEREELDQNDDTVVERTADEFSEEINLSANKADGGVKKRKSRRD